MIRKRTFLAIFLCLLANLSAFALKVKIYGKAETAAGYVIKLKQFSDLLTMKEMDAAETDVKADETFQLEAKVQSTQLFILQIGYQKSGIYLEPGKSYELSIKYDKTREQITYVNNPGLEYTFVNPIDEGLNMLIGQFNDQINRFIVDHFNQIYKNREKAIVNDFDLEIRKTYIDASEYFKTYINFRLASLEMNSGLMSKEKIFETYLKNKQIFKLNDEYWRFFGQFFEHYLNLPNAYFNNEQVLYLLNNNGDVNAVLSLLKKDPFLADDELRELVLLKGISENYFNPKSNKSALISMIEKLGKQTTFSSNSEIAQNMIQRIQYLRPGTKMPVAVVKDANGQDFVIGEVSPKAVFINFFTLPCNECVREMDSISAMVRHYSNDVQFVSIAINIAPDVLNKFIAEKKYPWEMINAGHAFDLAETYQISTLPSYFLIDKEGIIRFNPSLEPWAGFSRSFKSEFNY